MDINIEILPQSDYYKIVPLTLQLSPELKEELILQRLEEMKTTGFNIIGANDKLDDTLMAISGFWVNTKLYSGRYLEIDNFVVGANHRGKGLGKLMVDWMENYAKSINCQMIMLDAYIINTEAHKFYEREGFTKKGFHFLKAI
jgi:GNAT superfamily N-acetyltransferase